MKVQRLILSSIIATGFLLALVVTLSLPAYKEYRLMRASANGDLDKIHDLINAGVNVNSRYGDNGYTPLYLAASSGNGKALELLLKHDADPNITGSNGENALMIASYKGYADIVNILVSYGSEVNFQEARFGYTPLHEAARKGHLEIVNILLANGADRSIKASDGMTPVDKARAAGYEYITDILNGK